jgi:hypothetical protein
MAAANNPIWPTSLGQAAAYSFLSITLQRIADSKLLEILFI